MSENELVEIIRQTLEEHSKSMVTKSECSSKLWGLSKWITPVVLSICGAFVGALVTIKVDTSRIDTQQKINTTNISLLQASWHTIDYKLDLLLGKTPNLADHARN